jgi:transposase
MNITTVGIDLAKATFSLHGVDESGQVLLRRTIKRGQLQELVAKLPRCLIGMESGSGAHQWARDFQALGHEVKLMSPRFVAPYRHGDKNDGNDAEAICEAVRRPNMRFVPVKSLEQQAVLCLHRVHKGFIEERTSTLNRIRGLLAEFGYVLARRASVVRRAVPALLDQLPVHPARCLRDLLDHVRALDERIKAYGHQIAQHAKSDARAQLIQRRRGIGPMTASAYVANLGDGSEFKNGRQVVAWLGMVPKQHSTGGKIRLGQITRRGDRYLRTLLILGARSVLQRASRESDPFSQWALALRERRGYHRACVAIAAKNARVAWAMLQGREPRTA